MTLMTMFIMMYYSCLELRYAPITVHGPLHNMTMVEHRCSYAIAPGVVEIIINVVVIIKSFSIIVVVIIKRTIGQTIMAILNLLQ